MISSLFAVRTKFVFGALATLPLLFSTGCQSTSPRVVRYAEVTAPAKQFGLQIPQWAPDPKFADVHDAQSIRLTSLIVEADPELMEGLVPANTPKELERRGRERFVRMTDEESKAAEAKLLDANVKRLSAPRLQVYSGQRGHVLTVHQAAFIQDLTPVPPEKSGESSGIVPQIGIVNNGFVVDLKADIVGDEVQIDHLEIAHSRQLGMRLCEAKVFPRVLEQGHFFWQEPVLLHGEFQKPSQAIRVQDGGGLLVSLIYRVEQSNANARALAQNGRVKETYSPADPPADGHSPLEKEILVLVRAEIVDTEEPLPAKKATRQTAFNWTAYP